MSPVHTAKRQHSLTDYAKISVRSRLMEKVLEIEEMDVDEFDPAITDVISEIPELEMVDAEIDKIITRGLDDSRWVPSAEPRWNKDIASISNSSMAKTKKPKKRRLNVAKNTENSEYRNIKMSNNSSTAEYRVDDNIKTAKIPPEKANGINSKG
ncbi:putative eka-like protein [Golovinomyces cichoracearum]|uniref:Putative eka-like protein n=1 Tax=Golovinomyces cichoracearum TaxID=62708 RepID=A0A420H741_9PEZI|nr:putative eka-like protein [Golovinomyces cichoracearum]